MSEPDEVVILAFFVLDRSLPGGLHCMGQKASPTSLKQEEREGRSIHKPSEGHPRQALVSHERENLKNHTLQLVYHRCHVPALAILYSIAVPLPSPIAVAVQEHSLVLYPSPEQISQPICNGQMIFNNLAIIALTRPPPSCAPPACPRVPSTSVVCPFSTSAGESSASVVDCVVCPFSCSTGDTSACATDCDVCRGRRPSLMR